MRVTKPSPGVGPVQFGDDIERVTRVRTEEGRVRDFTFSHKDLVFRYSEETDSRSVTEVLV